MADDVETALAETALAETALAAAAGGALDFAAGPREGDLTVRLVAPARLMDVAVELVRGQAMALATVVATDERATDGDFKMRYVFEPGVAGAGDRWVTIVVPASAARPEVPSLTGVIPAANWHEREARDLFGIVPVGHPDPRALVLHDGWPAGVFPLRKDFDGTTRVAVEPAEEFPHLVAEGEGVFEIPVGPIHAGIIEPGHFRFTSVGETVLNLDARLFYTHRGIEKRMEGLSPTDAFYLAERVCGTCSVSHALGYCEALEQVAHVPVPVRALVVRAIVLELERLYNHVGDVGNVCAGAAFHYGTATGARLKERLQQLNERVSGNRFLRGIVIPGGVQLDLTAPLLSDIRARVDDTLRDLDALMQRIDENASVVDRFDGTGLVTRETAIDLAATGVAARASGVDRDARRDHPSGAYAMPDAPVVRVVTAEDGDAMARVQVRAGEARESVRLIHLFAAMLAPGELAIALPERVRAGTGIAAVESPRGEAVTWLRIDERGLVERYHLRSPSYHNWPVVALAATTAIVPDFPLVNKSFELCYSCTDR